MFATQGDKREDSNKKIATSSSIPSLSAATLKEQIIWATRTGGVQNLLIHGPVGCGKKTWVAAVLQAAFGEVNTVVNKVTTKPNRLDHSNNNNNNNNDDAFCENVLSPTQSLNERKERQREEIKWGQMELFSVPCSQKQASSNSGFVDLDRHPTKTITPQHESMSFASHLAGDTSNHNNHKSNSTTTLSSRFFCPVFRGPFHVEINPSDFYPQDHFVIQHVITSLVVHCHHNRYTHSRFIIVIHDADLLSPPAQEGLKRLLEKYHGTCRFFLIARSISGMNRALRSRLRAIRIAAPSCTEVDELIRQSCPLAKNQEEVEEGIKEIKPEFRLDHCFKSSSSLGLGNGVSVDKTCRVETTNQQQGATVANLNSNRVELALSSADRSIPRLRPGPLLNSNTTSHNDYIPFLKSTVVKDPQTKPITRNWSVISSLIVQEQWDAANYEYLGTCSSRESRWENQAADEEDEGIEINSHFFSSSSSSSSTFKTRWPISLNLMELLGRLSSLFIQSNIMEDDDTKTSRVLLSENYSKHHIQQHPNRRLSTKMPQMKQCLIKQLQMKPEVYLVEIRRLRKPLHSLFQKGLHPTDFLKLLLHLGKWKRPFNVASYIAECQFLICKGVIEILHIETLFMNLFKN